MTMNIKEIVFTSPVLLCVKMIVEKYLKEHGYDGLCNGGCGCGLGDDFMRCERDLGNGCIYADCEPAYKCLCECGNYFYSTAEVNRRHRWRHGFPLIVCKDCKEESKNGIR